ncbi:SHOCT domain-containing protein [Halomarina ordinaria]|uniref:SHOCT domain-containing protein n=1 Tax=Halomarina ordinaria TaxID=3033939 RepID=A0ABD5U864_9EURY|nr:SHOCT domain-containing protein [Halomarina sp. PSRA2]
MESIPVGVDVPKILVFSYIIENEMDISHTDRLASSLHRAMLGGLLAVFGLVAFGTLFRSLSSGSYLIGVVSLVVLVGCGFWVFSLFETGMNEGNSPPRGIGGTTREDDHPLAELRERYARGELSDDEFEQKTEALLETESDSPSERVSMEDTRLRE